MELYRDCNLRRERNVQPWKPRIQALPSSFRAIMVTGVAETNRTDFRECMHIS
jgi:hypothetical protein